MSRHFFHVIAISLPVYQVCLSHTMSHYESNIRHLENQLEEEEYYKKKYEVDQFFDEFFSGDEYYLTEPEARLALENFRVRLCGMRKVSPFHIIGDGVRHVFGRERE